MAERIQKMLAQLGLGSRRHIETWIREGRIRINGMTAHLGNQLTGTEQVELDGQPIALPGSALPTKRRVLAYYKPVGEVVSRHDPEGRPTVFQRLPRLRSGRWINVGRLDITTQGLLLLTNDGELAHRLMHPSRQIEREYAVRILGQVNEDTLQKLRTGVLLDDGKAHFDTVELIGGSGANRWYRVILREGRHREVRRLWESQGVTVSRLIRVRIGTISLRRGLPVGRWDELSPEQIQSLLTSVDMKQDWLETVPRSPAGGRTRQSARIPSHASRQTRRR